MYKLDKYWESQAQLRKELNDLGEKQITLLSKQFEVNFFEVYYGLGKVGGKEFSSIDTTMVKHLINEVWCADGKSWSSRVWKNTEYLAQTLNEELVNCLTTGKNPAELKKKLKYRFDVSYQQADTLVRTEMAHIQTQATKERYKEAGVEWVRFWAPKDERQCEECGKLHTKKYNLLLEQIPIPLHPNCRCNIVPIVLD